MPTKSDFGETIEKKLRLDDRMSPALRGLTARRVEFLREEADFEAALIEVQALAAMSGDQVNDLRRLAHEVGGAGTSSPRAVIVAARDRLVMGAEIADLIFGLSLAAARIRTQRTTLAEASRDLREAFIDFGEELLGSRAGRALVWFVDWLAGKLRR